MQFVRNRRCRSSTAWKAIACGLVTAIATLGCTDHPSINIIKTPPAVVHQTLDENVNSVKLIDAHTHWFFHCACEFFYDVEKHSVANGTHTVTLKVTGVNVNLSLPITVCLPAQPSKGLIDHENGHVRICEFIYDRAQNVARRLSEEVIGKELEGSGSTYDAACRQAIESASQSLAAHYRDETVKAAQRISDIFDELQYRNENGANVIDQDIQSAEEQYRKEKLKEKPSTPKIIS